MATKVKQPKVILKKYKNIPVSEDVYEQVALVSEANGFGQRGLGAQVAKWVARELPECDHVKEPVLIEYYPGETRLHGGVHLMRSGYFCATCKRVYAKVSEEELVQEDGEKLLKAVQA